MWVCPTAGRRLLRHRKPNTSEVYTTMSKTGLQGLLTPKESVLLLIDHQPFQFANVNSHEPSMIVNNVIGQAKNAKVFVVPTLLTAVYDVSGRVVLLRIS